MIHRRLFLGGLLAAAAGPAIVRATSLMPIKAPKAITITLDMGTGCDSTVLIQGEIGHWQGMRVIPSEAVKAAEAALGDFMDRYADRMLLAHMMGDKADPAEHGRLVHASMYDRPIQVTSDDDVQVHWSWSNPYR